MKAELTRKKIPKSFGLTVGSSVVVTPRTLPSWSLICFLGRLSRYNRETL
ncbi:MAG: hypothetical protein NZL96_01440 [Patescibacteria group bacterium]|nr:hypothetical protein [Patescibacteria group bacterium]